MEMNNIVILVAYEPPEPGYGPQIQVIAYDQRDRAHAQRLTPLEKPTVGVREEVIVMTSFYKVGQKTKNLSLATPPMPLRINM